MDPRERRPGAGRIPPEQARDDEEIVLVDSDLDRWADVLAELPTEVSTVVCGHTHMPFTPLRRTAFDADALAVFGPKDGRRVAHGRGRRSRPQR